MVSRSRKSDELRKVVITKGYLKNALGSCLIQMGDTKVLCTATLEDKVPHFLKDSPQGWLTAEYGMIPASCSSRIARESSKGRPSGRTQEIQRLIGRSLRAVVDLTKLSGKTLWMDADVLQGDGGTRTAAITGCFIALAEAVQKCLKTKLLAENPIRDYVAAVSVGILKGQPVLDLCYEQDSQAEVDMNLVMTGSGRWIEIQGTAEREPFNKRQLDHLLAVGQKGIRQLIEIEKKFIRL
ncbi:MAG: ribonuclease PH [Candidatus Omnitrophota bacterium]